jgi:hypothetical protein
MRRNRFGGRALQSRAFQASLTLARVHQYQAYVANPDPTGSSEAAYLYRFAPRSAPVSVHGRSSLGPAWIA